MGKMMKRYLAGMILIIAPTLFAGAPIVNNVTFAQRTNGSFLVDIYFDAIDTDGDILEILIEASIDSGKTWTVPCSTLTGDVGKNIEPGNAKHVIWDFYADMPDTNSNDFIIRVTAEEFAIDTDGNAYPIIMIGNQDWFAQNIKTTHYRNGDPIPLITDNTEWTNTTTPACCIYNNNEDNAAIYGNLYNWYAIDDKRNIAPRGWYVPKDEDFLILERYLGMSTEQSNKSGWRGQDEGGKLKSKGTREKGTGKWFEPNTGATNESGFTALPAGYRNCYTGEFYQQGLYSYFWSATEVNSESAWYRYLFYSRSDIYRYDLHKNQGLSVRLVRPSKK